ncbi:ZZ-type zinc finger-containing protein 3 [Microdochium nivale]|nr:ZZ-type zinc finger-containing protein 3 [Microdochium nivale]
MPGLTLDTNIAAAGEPIISNPSARQDAKPVEQQEHRSTLAGPARTSISPDRNAPQDNGQQASPSSRRSESPPRPPYSPITPPLRASELPQRPEYTHLEQLPQTMVEPPRPEPIDFASNPDVLALQSAISILQMQKRRAAADMVTLSKAKGAALANPTAFLADLSSHKIRYEGDGLFDSGGQGSDSDDTDSEDDGEGVAMDEAKASNTASATPKPQKQSRSRNSASDSNTGELQSGKQAQQPWERLPKPQSVVRMPAINWAQYAIVGESLDRIHQEQVNAPAQGSPVVMQTNGTFDFNFNSTAPSAGAGNGNTSPTSIFNRQEKLVGIAAPYNPGKDKLAPQKKSSNISTPGTSQQQQAQKLTSLAANNATATAPKR